jgi:hypothetical protein
LFCRDGNCKKSRQALRVDNIFEIIPVCFLPTNEFEGQKMSSLEEEEDVAMTTALTATTTTTTTSTEEESELNLIQDSEIILNYLRKNYKMASISHFIGLCSPHFNFNFNVQVSSTLFPNQPFKLSF